MLVAHLPAGVLLTRAVARRPLRLSRDWPGLLGAVFPDLDILYFYLIDGRQHLHHTYWTHIPFTWLLVGLVAVVAWRAKPSWIFLQRFFVWFLLNVFLHLFLDSIAAEILWLAPFSYQAFGLFAVPAEHSHWILNFLLHGTFWFEIAIVLGAGILLFVDGKRIRRG